MNVDMVMEVELNFWTGSTKNVKLSKYFSLISIIIKMEIHANFGNFDDNFG